MNLKIEEGKFSVIRSESGTGIVVNNDNSRYSNMGDDYYKIFDNLELAITFIKEDKKKYSNIFEYYIQNHHGDCIEFFR